MYKMQVQMNTAIKEFMTFSWLKTYRNVVILCCSWCIGYFNRTCHIANTGHHIRISFNFPEIIRTCPFFYLSKTIDILKYATTIFNFKCTSNRLFTHFSLDSRIVPVCMSYFLTKSTHSIQEQRKRQIIWI